VDLNKEAILEVIKSTIFGKTLYIFDAVDSTNKVAWHLALEGKPEGTVVIADYQYRGRGRESRIWFSPPGVNLYMSVILRPKINAELISPLPLLSGVAVAECMSNFFPEKVSLKWPNDVLLSGKKVAGILMETKVRGNQVDFVILGIGININLDVTTLPEELRERATSMRAEKGEVFSRVGVISDLLYHLEGNYLLFLNLGFSVIKARWLYFSPLYQPITVRSGEETISGIVTELDDRGALFITDDEGKIHRILAGNTLLT